MKLSKMMCIAALAVAPLMSFAGEKLVSPTSAQFDGKFMVVNAKIADFEQTANLNVTTPQGTTQQFMMFPIGPFQQLARLTTNPITGYPIKKVTGQEMRDKVAIPADTRFEVSTPNRIKFEAVLKSAGLAGKIVAAPKSKASDEAVTANSGELGTVTYAISRPNPGYNPNGGNITAD
ncbi:MAG: hypothetical protein K0S08_1334 [Gammaproteobacteria bacterium]|jgi:hypothetical protein|nr:hypothetical protein [Gammaproteobacteria bacterium]